MTWCKPLSMSSWVVDMPWVSYKTDQFPPMTETDKQNNVTIIYNELSAKGYSLEAISAICGNMESEGILNPAQYEIGRNYDVYNYGAGLCGWTPVYVTGSSATHLGNWCDSEGLDWLDGDSQLKYLDYELTDWNGTERFFRNPSAPSCGYPTNPPITAKEFIASAENVNTLAAYWMLYYEHPANPKASMATRKANASKWYEYLSDSPTPPDPPTPIKTNKLPLWMMLRPVL